MIKALEKTIVRVLLVCAAIFCTIMGAYTGNMNWWKAAGGCVTGAVCAFLFL